jgi:hypothetical protein
MGNAVRHTADHTILVRVFPMGPVKPKSLRLVIANALTQADRATLSPSVLAKLWHGYTTTGSGLGLNASAALVAEAFGLECPDRAIDLGYVGSRVTENGYICWTTSSAIVTIATICVAVTVVPCCITSACSRTQKLKR